MGQLIADLPTDDRVDILKETASHVVDELLPLIPADERRDILRLRAYREGTAGAVMTTEFARLRENLTASQALDEVRRQAEELETIYYLYVVDDADHLRGLVSLRQLLSRADARVADVMQRDVVTVGVTDDQEEVAQELARFDFLAIPVVDSEHRILGIVTHDDVIDVVRDEATEDAHRIAAVEPLRLGYLETRLLVLTWKRGIWLTILCVGALLTAVALQRYESTLAQFPFLILFLPLVISTGGNSGSQSATLPGEHEHRILGIVTHDDVIDVVRDEATEDAHRIAAVEPLRLGYLETRLLVLTWKRGIWLTILCVGALLTAVALQRYESTLAQFPFLILFLPLVISTGGNCASIGSWASSPTTT